MAARRTFGKCRNQTPIKCLGCFESISYVWRCDCNPFRAGSNMTLKIEQYSDRHNRTLRLIGRMRAEHLAELETQIREGGSNLVLDLEEVTLVDAEVVRFLGTCEAQGVSLINCSLYIRDWIVRERSYVSAQLSSQKEKNMSGKLEGKIALITGGSTGIGLATATRFVAEGAYVYITGRRQPELDAAVASIGSNVTAIQGDVTKSADLDRIYARIGEEKGKLDIVFANAGGGPLVPLGSLTEEHYDSVFNVNVKGLVFTVQKALPFMPNGSAIILTGSIVDVKGFPSFSIYSATKAAVRSFARTWTTDLKDRGIRVNVVSPGPIDTPLLNESFASPDDMKALASTVVMGRLGRPEEIASAVTFLASADASFITGAELYVDGGSAQV